MSVKNFIKQNLALSAGIVLPVLLVILFMIASTVPKMLAEPPRHALVFSTKKYDNNPGAKFNVYYTVKEGKLQAQVAMADSKRPAKTDRLYIYEPGANIVRDITPAFEKAGTFPVPETKNALIDTANMSPDGYAFETWSRYGGSVFSLFGGSYRDRAPVLQKDGNRVQLPDDSRISFYNNPHFIGWVIREETK